MYLLHGKARGNGQASQRIYRKRFFDRHQPNHSLLEPVNRSLSNFGSLIGNRIGEQAEMDAYAF